MLGGIPQVAQLYSQSPEMNYFDSAKDEAAFVRSRPPLPTELAQSYRPPTPWPVSPTCQKDFVLVCEFSELEGPKPLITIPKDGGSSFDKNMYAVKIMAVDYNATNYARSTYGEKRDERELKDQWRRMKLQAKSEWSSFRSQTGKTGGGPPPAEPSMMAKEVKRLVPTEFSEMRNPFDDDCFITGNNPEAVTAELFIAGEKRPSLNLDSLDQPSEGATAPLALEASRHPPPTLYPVTAQQADATPSTSSHISLHLDRSTPSKRFRGSPSPIPPQTPTQTVVHEAIREWGKKEHETKLHNMEEERQQKEEEHKARMQLLQLEKSYILKKLEIIESSLKV